MNWRVQLRQALIQHFSESDIKSLCFDLGVDYEELSGENKTEKVISIIEYFGRVNDIPRLISHCSQYRPNVPWDEIAEAASKEKTSQEVGLHPQSKALAKSGRRTGFQIIAILAIVVILVFSLTYIAFQFLVPSSEPEIVSTPVLVTTELPTTESLEAVISSFDGTSTEGWDFHEGAFENPGTGGSGGGPNNGYLKVTEDVHPITGYFIAPAKFHGDWRGYSELHVDLWSSDGEHFTSGYGAHGDIYLANGAITAQRMLPNRPPDGIFQTFIVPLVDDGKWVLGGVDIALEDVLKDVTEFQIRGEYGYGDDTTGLDNVKLIPNN